MKKIFIILGVILLLSGCGKYTDKDLVKDLSKKVNDSKAYHMTGTLEIYRNEEKYTYNVESSYKEGDLFKVNLTNQNNNHEQIILKNTEGVYVLTPTLNKSFKFQSDWPYNNSQIYLLQPILTDLTNDEERKFEKNGDGYIITSKVNYSTEKEFKNQKVYIDKDKNITKVEVLDSSNNAKMRLTVIDIDYKAKFEKDYFSASKYLSTTEPKESNTQNNNTNTNEKDKNNKTQTDNSKQYNTNTENNTQNKTQTGNDNKNNTQTNNKNTSTTNKTSECTDKNSEACKTTKSDKETSKIEDIVYPMYVPVDTYLSGQDVVQTSNGERIILTFTGESAFTVVQETLATANSTNYIYGDPYLILDTVGAITDYSVSWISNGVEYSVMSDTMQIDELLTVAQSISVGAVTK